MSERPFATRVFLKTAQPRHLLVDLPNSKRFTYLGLWIWLLASCAPSMRYRQGETSTSIQYDAAEQFVYQTHPGIIMQAVHTELFETGLEAGNVTPMSLQTKWQEVHRSKTRHEKMRLIVSLAPTSATQRGYIVQAKRLHILRDKTSEGWEQREENHPAADFEWQIFKRIHPDKAKAISHRAQSEESEAYASARADWQRRYQAYCDKKRHKPNKYQKCTRKMRKRLGLRASD